MLRRLWTMFEDAGVLDIASGVAVAWAFVEFVRSLIATVMNTIVRKPEVYTDLRITDYGTFVIPLGDRRWIDYGPFLRTPSRWRSSSLQRGSS